MGVEQAADSGQDPGAPGVKVVPMDEYEAIMAELHELRPLRQDLLMIAGIAGRHGDGEVGGQ